MKMGSVGFEVLYKDKAAFDRKRAKLMAGGITKLQVIADFDRTLSTLKHPWRKSNLSCHGVVESYSKFPPSYKERSQALFEKYYPLEVSIDLSFEEKFKMCEEWWGQAHELLLEYKVNKGDIEHMVNEAELTLRDGVDAFFKLLEQHHVPCLVFSAGIADVIEEVLQQQKMLLPSTHVISNRLVYDSDGTAVAFDSHIIHSLNKNEAAAIDDHPYWGEVAERPNVLLLGDSLTDMQMSEGVAHKEEQVAIGFLNEPTEQKLKLYMDTFDCVITNDAPFNFVNQFLQSIIDGSSH